MVGQSASPGGVHAATMPSMPGFFHGRVYMFWFTYASLQAAEAITAFLERQRDCICAAWLSHTWTPDTNVQLGVRSEQCTVAGGRSFHGGLERQVMRILP